MNYKLVRVQKDGLNCSLAILEKGIYSSLFPQGFDGMFARGRLCFEHVTLICSNMNTQS